MQELGFKDLEEFRAPSRKPWLLLILLLVAGLAVALHYWRKAHPPVEPPPEPPAMQAAEPPTQKPLTMTPPVASPAAPVVTPPQDAVVTPPATVPARPLQGDPLAEATALEKAGRLDAALLRCHEGLRRTDLGERQRAAIEQRIGRLNTELVFTPRTMPEKQTYIVKRGDSIERLAKQFGTTIDLIVISNRIKNKNLVKAGDQLRIYSATPELLVSKSRNDLVVSMNGVFFKRYRVGTGEFGKTPTGTFKVVDRVPEPDWWRPDGKVVRYTGDPKGENILGTRWLALEATGETPAVKGYGIHGTWDESSVGKALSAGCIRLTNRDVEELYAVVPMGTKVTIVE